MLAVLVLVGAIALRQRWSIAALAAIGVGLWLFVMLVVMPLTGRRASSRSTSSAARAAAILGHLSAALVYSGILAPAGLAIDRWQARARCSARGLAPSAGHAARRRSSAR